VAEENNKESNSSDNSTGGPWWKQGMQMFSEISTWIAVPIILAVIGGKALDEHLGTKHLFLLLFAGLAFLLSAYGIIKTVKAYTSKIKNNK